jgi:uncharacterized protein (TIGR02996 family)
MSDEHALFIAILAQPDEDVPRLMYADWLDEHGDAAGRGHAEFIRLQIELARGGLNDRRRKTVTDRYTALENAHGKEWLAPFHVACGGVPVSHVFRRGFISDIAGESKLPAVFPDLAAMYPVQRVDIDFSWAQSTGQDSTRMAECPALARLRWLECRRFPEDFGKAVLASPHLAGLQTLYLQWGWLENGVELVSRSPVAQNLKHLWIWGASVGSITPGRGFGKILETEWPALTQLRLDNLAVGEHGMLAVVREAVNRGWHAVHVDEHQISEPGVTTALGLVLASNLRSVSLTRYCDLNTTPTPVPDDAKLLSLSHFHTDGDSLLRWVVANVPPGRFNRLALSHSTLLTSTVRTFAKWTGLAHLNELDLRGNQIDDAGAAALAASPHLEDVKQILFARNNITEKGKEALKKRFARRVRVAE